MALIDCPSCGKKISDKAQQCNHCHFDVGNADPEQLARKEGLRRYQQRQRLQNHSMLALLLFIAGFAYVYFADVNPETVQYKSAVAVSIVGVVWYLVNRVRLVLAKRQ